MKKLSINFEKKHILALLKGNLKKAKRTTGLEYLNKNPSLWEFVKIHNGMFVFSDINGNQKLIGSRYGLKGDTLYVKEKWCPGYDHTTGENREDETPHVSIIYRADESELSFPVSYEKADNWARRFSEDDDFADCIDISPSRMPIAFSRISLTVTEVSVKRSMSGSRKPKSPFDEILEQASKKKSNPWVWVVKFEVKEVRK